MLVLVLGGGLAREGEEGLVLLVLYRGRPSRRGQVTGSVVLAEFTGAAVELATIGNARPDRIPLGWT